jgi:polysaccharide deacetylase 2 family uncharacterized protein YibQ
VSVRPRRRRRPATKRRVRRWLRRQDPLKRGLLLGAAALVILAVALVLAPPREEPREQRAVEATPPVDRAPSAAARRTAGAGGTLARPRPEAPAPALPKAPSATPRTAPAVVAEHPVAPRLAIVIDDLGQSFSHLEQIAGLELPLSIAVIPGLPASARTVREASRRGIELLLHQPMEPREEGGKNPGEGVLLTTMTAETLRARMRESLAAVPGAVGVNNHMGSRFTEDAAALGAVMAELKERNLFWLDSRTTAATRGAEVARSFGVPAIERDVFIDAEMNADFIRGQVRKLLDLARLHGAAVGIGHPHPETLAVLRELRAELLASGVTLVPVSALVRSAPANASGAALASSLPRAEHGAGEPRGQGSTTP